MGSGRSNDGVISVAIMDNYDDFENHLLNNFAELNKKAKITPGVDKKSFNKDLRDIETEMKSLSKQMKEIKANPSMDGKEFQAFKKEINETITSLQQRMGGLENTFKDMFKAADAGDANGFVQVLRDWIDGSKEFIDYGKGIVDVIEGVHKAGKNVNAQIIDKSQEDTLKKQLQTLKEIQSVQKQIVKDGKLDEDAKIFNDLKIKDTNISPTSYQKQLNEYYRAFQNTKNKIDAYSNNQLSLTSAELVDLEQTANSSAIAFKNLWNALSISKEKKYQAVAEAKSEIILLGNTTASTFETLYNSLEKGIISVTSSVSKHIKDVEDQLTVLGVKVEETKEKAQKPIKSSTKEDTGAVIGIKTSPEELKEKLSDLLSLTQGFLNNKPLKAKVELDTKWGSQRNQKALENFEAKIQTLTASGKDTAKLQKIYDDVKKTFEKDIQFKIDTNYTEKAEEIDDACQKIEDAIQKHNWKIDPELHLSTQSGDAFKDELQKLVDETTLIIKNIDVEDSAAKEAIDKSALSGIFKSLLLNSGEINDSTFGVYEHIEKISDLLESLPTITDRVCRSINDMARVMMTAFHVPSIDELDNSFASLQKRVKDVSKLIEEAGGIKGSNIKGELQSILDSYVQYENEGGQQRWQMLGGGETVQRWFRNHFKTLIEETEKEKQQAQGEVQSKWNELGSAVSKGYSEGIIEAIPEVETAVTKMVEAGIEAARNAQDSHSPSKVYKSLAHDAANGYINGVAEKAPAIKAAIDKAISESIPKNTNLSELDAVTLTLSKARNAFQNSDKYRSSNFELSQQYSGTGFDYLHELTDKYQYQTKDLYNIAKLSDDEIKTLAQAIIDSGANLQKAEKELQAQADKFFYRGVTDKNALGQLSNQSIATFFTDDERIAKGYGEFIDKVRLDVSKMLQVDANGMAWNDIQILGDGKELASKTANQLADTLRDAVQQLKSKGVKLPDDFEPLSIVQTETAFSATVKKISELQEKASTAKNDRTQKSYQTKIKNLQALRDAYIDAFMAYKSFSDNTNHIYGTKTTDQLAEYAHKNGYEGINILNARDGKGIFAGKYNEASQIVGVFKDNVIHTNEAFEEQLDRLQLIVKASALYRASLAEIEELTETIAKRNANRPEITPSPTPTPNDENYKPKAYIKGLKDTTQAAKATADAIDEIAEAKKRLTPNTAEKIQRALDPTFTTKNKASEALHAMRNVKQSYLDSVEKNQYWEEQYQWAVRFVRLFENYRDNGGTKVTLEKYQDLYNKLKPLSKEMESDLHQLVDGFHTNETPQTSRYKDLEGSFVDVGNAGKKAGEQITLSEEEALEKAQQLMIRIQALKKQLLLLSEETSIFDGGTLHRERSLNPSDVDSFKFVLSDYGKSHEVSKREQDLYDLIYRYDEAIAQLQQLGFTEFHGSPIKIHKLDTNLLNFRNYQQLFNEGAVDNVAAKIFDAVKKYKITGDERILNWLEVALDQEDMNNENLQARLVSAVENEFYRLAESDVNESDIQGALAPEIDQINNQIDEAAQNVHQQVDQINQDLSMLGNTPEELHIAESGDLGQLHEGLSEAKQEVDELEQGFERIKELVAKYGNLDLRKKANQNTFDRLITDQYLKYRAANGTHDVSDLSDDSKIVDKIKKRLALAEAAKKEAEAKKQSQSQDKPKDTSQQKQKETDNIKKNTEETKKNSQAKKENQSQGNKPSQTSQQQTKQNTDVIKKETEAVKENTEEKKKAQKQNQKSSTTPPPTSSKSKGGNAPVPPKNTGDSINGINNEGKAFSDLAPSADDAAKSKQEFADKNREVLKSIVDSIKGLDSEAKAFENLNKLINNLNGQNGSVKLQNTIDGLKAIREVFNMPLDENNLLSGLKELSDKGANLADIATVLKATQNQIKNAKAAANQSNAPKPDFLSGGNTEFIRDNAKQYLESQNLQVINTRIQQARDGFVDIIAVVKTAQNTFQEYFLHTTDGLTMTTVQADENTARLAKQLKIYAQAKRAFDQMNQQSGNVTDDLTIDPADLGSDAWNTVINAMNEYGIALGNIKTITRQVRKDMITGDDLESFNIVGDGFDVTLGKDGFLFDHQTMANATELIKHYNSLNECQKHYYEYQARIAAGSASEVEKDKVKEWDAEIRQLSQDYDELKKRIGNNTDVDKAKNDFFTGMTRNYSEYLQSYVTTQRNRIDKAKQNRSNVRTAYVDEFNGEIRESLNLLDQLEQTFNSHSSSPWLKSEIKNAQQLQAVIDETIQRLTDKSNIGTTKDAVEKLISKIGRDMNDNTAMPKSLTNKYSQLLSDLQAIQFKANDAGVQIAEIDQISFSKLQTQFNSLHAELETIGQKGKSFADKIGAAITANAAQFFARFASFYDLIRYGREAYSTINQLDYALVDLKKTTTMTTSDLNAFYKSSNDIAKQNGVTTKTIIDQASAWSRLGYSSKEEAETMAKLSSQFKAISPGMTEENATDGLVSTMQAFHIGVADVQREVMDNVNRIGNTMATSNDEIVEMLKRSSAAMQAANNTIEETIALESAAVQITRNAETTGTAFRTNEIVLMYSNVHISLLLIAGKT